MDDRENIMWIIRIRAKLGYSNAIYRHAGDPLTRWGEETSISTEAVNPQFDAVDEANTEISDGTRPEYLGYNLRAMLYPDEKQIGEFQQTYQIAVRVSTADFSAMPNKGYDSFKGYAPGQTNNYTLGLDSKMFVEHGNFYSDSFPGDNIFLGLVSCADIQKTIPNYMLVGPSGSYPAAYVKDFSCPPS